MTEEICLNHNFNHRCLYSATASAANVNNVWHQRLILLKLW